MKLIPSLNNPYYDFVIKSVLTLYFTPYFLAIFFVNLYLFLEVHWGNVKGEGLFVTALLSEIVFYVFFILGFFLALFIILFFNKKLMSGERILNYNSMERFTRLKLFIISFIIFAGLYWLTLPLLLSLPIDTHLYDSLDALIKYINK